MRTDLYGQSISCQCGRTHVIEPRAVVYGEDAIRRLPGLCAEATAGRRAAVFMDLRTRQAAGEEACSVLQAAGWSVGRALVTDGPGGKSPVCDEPTKQALAPAMAGAYVVLTVGSGVVTDLGKWLAFEASLPFLSFATAASMNGYASANVAPTMAGVKSLLGARAARAVASSPAVLTAAPYEMTAAGLGDVLAKSVSSADWFLNHFLFGDYYCPRSVGLIAQIEPLYLEHPEAIAQRQPAAMEALFEALVLTGVAMTMAESSAPASGGEHLISHSLDMMSGLDGREHDLHGRQVGVGTILTAELYRRLLAIDRPRWREVEQEVDAGFWGRLSGAVAEQYARKLPRLREVPRLLFGARWDELRRELRSMLRPPEVIKGCLQRAGAAHRAGDIGCDHGRLLAALQHGREIRSRVTILDLAAMAGILPEAGEEIARQWA